MDNNNEAEIMAAIEAIRAEGIPTKVFRQVDKALCDIVTSVSCYNFNAGFEGYEHAAFRNALAIHKLLGTCASADLVIATPKRMENIDGSCSPTCLNS
jgi:hypothetical protein